jgi:NAD-dependent dihydropyrimidine dehydrogenase PreA subunit
MKATRPIIEIDEALCNGCGECVPSCHEGAIQIINGKAKLVAERFCDGLGACLGHCPTGALKVVERPAEGFDEVAVEEHLKTREAVLAGAPAHAGCPSARIASFAHKPAAAADDDAPSALGHWPVQIRLVPPDAPFLRGADLLVAADCVPVAYRGFHKNLLEGHAVMMGCPKFDDPEPALQRFIDLFRMSGIRSVTVAVMQVPCCQGLPAIVTEAMRRSGESLPVDLVTVSLQGEILRRERLIDAPGARTANA